MTSTIDNPGDSKLMNWIREHLSYPHDYCLIWPFGRTRDGYGTIGREGKNLKAHRFICTLVHGEPPTPKHQAAHSCGRGADGCCNPRHIRWKTPSENTLEKPSRPRRKLTPDQVVEIRGLKGLERVQDTSERFGVTECNIRKIQSGKLWGQDRRVDHHFTDAQVIEIRKLPDLRAARRKAEELGVSYTTTYSIWTRRTFKHVPEEIRPMPSPQGTGT